MRPPVAVGKDGLWAGAGKQRRRGLHWSRSDEKYRVGVRGADRGLHPGRGEGGGEKQVGSGSIFKLEPTGFSSDLIQGLRELLRLPLGFGPETLEDGDELL